MIDRDDGAAPQGSWYISPRPEASWAPIEHRDQRLPISTRVRPPNGAKSCAPSVSEHMAIALLASRKVRPIAAFGERRNGQPAATQIAGAIGRGVVESRASGGWTHRQ